jgi:acetate---CoA ligase (ADP-forming)
MLKEKMGKAELFFKARTIAVVGAAREEFKVGHTIFRNILACKTIRVFPVNPNAKEILGQRCYKDLSEIPYEVDLVVIVVKAEIVSEVLRQAGRKGIRAAVVISTGFSESGNSELEREVRDMALRNDIAILGPNVLGFIDPYRGINATFFDGMPEKGKIAFISQSGALGVATLDIAIKEKIGFSGFVSMGNMSMLDFSDFIEHYSEDENTKVIALYIEGLKEGTGKKFIEVCKKASRNKLIIAIKSGKSKKGSEAAKSHTASLASEQGVYESIFRQAGIVEAESVSELFSLASIYSRYGEIGKRACVITNAGGLGVLCTDSCSRSGIEVVGLPAEIIFKLDEILLPGWSHGNPIDLLGEALAEKYQEVINLLDGEKWFDFFIVLLTPQHMTQPLETAKILIETKKPVIACFMGGNKIEDAEKFLRGKIPFFRDVSEFSFLGKIT